MTAILQFMCAVRMCRSSGCRELGRNETTDFTLRPGKRGGLARLVDGEAFSIDELDIGHAEEAQELAHVRGLRVARRALIQAAAHREHVHLLASQQADWPVNGIAESDTGAGDVVEIRLERGGHAE